MYLYSCSRLLIFLLSVKPLPLRHSFFLPFYLPFICPSSDFILSVCIHRHVFSLSLLFTCLVTCIPFHFRFHVDCLILPLLLALFYLRSGPSPSPSLLTFLSFSYILFATPPLQTDAIKPHEYIADVHYTPTTYGVLIVDVNHCIIQSTPAIRTLPVPPSQSLVSGFAKWFYIY